MPENARKQRGSALGKAIQVLEALADQPQAIGLPDLAARLDLPRQTVHRILQQLEENRLVLRDPARDRYSVGPRLSRLALLALHSANQGAAARAILQELVEDIRETCNIGVLDGLEFVYLERIECDWPLRVHLQAGSRVPAYCTSGGKALLAHLPAEARAGLLRSVRLKSYTENTITDAASLERALAEIRDSGHAVNDQEFTVGIVGLAVPIVGEDKRPLAALALHAPVTRLPLSAALGHLGKLKTAAERLARTWGLRPAPGELAA